MLLNQQSTPVWLKKHQNTQISAWSEVKEEQTRHFK